MPLSRPPAADPADSPKGWRVVAGVHFLSAVIFGSSYSFAALFPGLSQEFGASRGEVALVFSISAFVFYLLGAVSGPLADRIPPRRLIFAGLAAMIAGYAGAAWATTLMALYACYGAGVGVGIGLCYVPSLGAVQSWFERERARASGIASAGLGLGTLVLPFATGKAVPYLGWRGSFAALAAVVALVGLPAAALVRRRRVAPADPAAVPAGRPSLAAAWRQPRFRLFYASLLLASFCTFIPYVHVVPAARDLGLSLETGTLLVGLIGVGSLAGRFGLSGLGDRIGRLTLLAILTFAVAASFALWALAQGIAMLVLFALVFGVSYGGCVGLYPAVAAELFGARNIGAMLGYLYTAVGIAALTGPTLAGIAFDRTGSYLAPIAASAVAAVAAGILTLRLRRL